jgi:hypothetical protein
MSKKAKADAYDAVKARADLLHEALWNLINRQPIAVECVTRDDGATEEFRLYSVERSHGGIVVHLFVCPGQSTSVDVDTADSWFQGLARLPHGIGASTELKIAAERLQSVRARYFEREVGICDVCAKDLPEHGIFATCGGHGRDAFVASVLE